MNENTHFEELIVLYIDGELDRSQTKKVLNHLENCKECREIYGEYLDLKKNVFSFYRKVYPKNLERKMIRSNMLNKIGYALVALVFLFASLVFFMLSPKEKKIQSDNLLRGEEIDIQINQIERQINYYEKQFNREIL